MMDKAIAQQMFADMARRVEKYAEGHTGTLRNLADAAGNVKGKISAFLELKDTASATQVLFTGERLSAELEKLKQQVVKDGLTYNATLTLAMDEVCGIAELDAFGREIRDKVAKMDPPARIMLVQDAIKVKDSSIFSALLHYKVSTLLTGLSEEHRQQFRDQLYKVHASNLYETREAASNALDLVETMIRQALEIINSTLGLPGLLAEAAKTKKRGAAEAALGLSV